MRTPPAILSALALLAAGLLSASQTHVPPASDPAAVSSMEKKLQQLESNGRASRPDPSPTEFAEQEVNAYFAAGKVKLPAGVHSVHFEGQAAVVTATLKVDFDQIKTGRNSNNPLLSIFTGVHTVVAVAHAHGKDGQGWVHVDSVALDGSEIPPFVLQVFVQKFLQPRYPDIGIDSRFPLPDRIDSATVGWQKLILIQR